MRENILDLTEDAVDKIKEYAKEAQEKIKNAVEDGKEAFVEKNLSWRLPLRPVARRCRGSGLRRSSEPNRPLLKSPLRWAFLFQ